MYKPDMRPLESSFTVCAWVKKQHDIHAPTWFSYSTREQTFEIDIADSGYHTRIFGDAFDLRSVYTVPHGQWFHNCLSWSAASQTRNVYINGVLVDAEGTPGGKTLGQDGYLVIGNEQDVYGGGMDSDHMFGGNSINSMYLVGCSPPRRYERCLEVCAPLLRRDMELRDI